MSAAFLLTALIVCVSPGIGVVYTLATAIRGGVRAGLLASVGCTLCTMLHLGFALLGLAAVLHTTAVLFQTIKFAGVAYLLWMAWATLRGHGSLDLRPAAADVSAGRIVWRGVLLNPSIRSCRCSSLRSCRSSCPETIRTQRSSSRSSVRFSSP